MQITINGEMREFPESSLTISTLLHMLEVDSRQVAVEKNLEIVAKSQYDKITVAAGDKVELVEFVGGG